MATLQLSGTTLDHDTDWADFRKWIDGTYARLRYTWTDTGAAYIVVALDGPVFRTVGINKSDPPDAVQQDFEQHYQSNHTPFEPRSDQGLPVVAPSAYAYANEATRFVGKLYTFASGDSASDLKVEKQIRLQGGYYWVQGANPGDTVTLAVVDVDGLVAPAGTVLVEYVKSMPVAPWNHQQEIIAATAGTVPSGMYLRVSYNNVGAAPVSFGVTYRWLE